MYVYKTEEFVCPVIQKLFTVKDKVPVQCKLTVIEAGFVVRVASVLHEHTLGQVCVEGDLGRLGSHKPHKLTSILVLFPIALRQVMVAVEGVKIEPVMLRRGVVDTTCGLHGSENLNLQQGHHVSTI